jgi:hypothetical protein
VSSPAYIVGFLSARFGYSREIAKGNLKWVRLRTAKKAIVLPRIYCKGILNPRTSKRFQFRRKRTKGFSRHAEAIISPAARLNRSFVGHWGFLREDVKQAGSGWMRRSKLAMPEQNGKPGKLAVVLDQGRLKQRKNSVGNAVFSPLKERTRAAVAKE